MYVMRFWHPYMDPATEDKMFDTHIAVFYVTLRCPPKIPKMTKIAILTI